MIQVFPNAEVLSHAAAQLFVDLAHQCMPKGRFTVALSGGETPRRTYELLATSPYIEKTPWRIVQFFWSDERWIPPYDPQSNEYMARKALLDHIPVPEDQIHSMHGATDPQGAAVAYEGMLRHFFTGEKTLFDLVFLGLGKDGHTASLFPEAPIPNNPDRWVSDVYLPTQDMFRLTLTPSIINRSAKIVFLVNGEEKAESLQHILEGPNRPEQWPAQLIHPLSGDILWLVDQAAASRIDTTHIQPVPLLITKSSPPN
jgi:6-phosphogluconolactonase